MQLMPTTTGNLESVLPHIALGTTSGTGGELSSQYNVRGGNYDENLVYVNDFEIYRPQLIRAGQQEGLTFPNIDLIQSLSFSSGGFEAKYGDKMSSVLDIKYKLPDEFKASLSGSFLGGSAHLEGSLGDSLKFRYLLGARYKTTRYLLGSLDVSGEYQPNFTDIQAYVTQDISTEWQLGILANYNRSVYDFIPQSRETGLGLVNFALQLTSVFEGREIDEFTTQMGGVSLTYLPRRDRNPLFVKLLVSNFQSLEQENFDIIGRYSLQEIEADLGSESFGDVANVLGTGTQQQFVRNTLLANVSTAELKGGWELQVNDNEDDDQVESTHFLQWSLQGKYEQIDDRLNEWERLDSAGYSLPFDTSAVQVFRTLKTENQLESARFSAYLQDTYTFRQDSIAELRFSLGVRATYWSLNEEFNLSPRAQLLYKPLKSGKDIAFRLAGGLYVQPPFYRELRNIEGEVNTNLLSQKSAHIVGGLTWDFGPAKNPTKFRFISEVYYKQLWDLVSYDIENVRIRYAGENNATGYVTGLDLRLNGEFVPGAESWFNLSFLRAREALNGVEHRVREPGMLEGEVVQDVPRPSDRLMNFSVFFQDYLPNNERAKMNLNITVGSGLPYGLLGNNTVYRNTYRFAAYHRVDVGFAYAFWDRNLRKRKPNHPLRFTESAWLSLEIFNLMQVQNVASNTWVKTIFERQYAIPNYLTTRRINLRFKVDF
ncbi:MAG: TonB-dependent receptor plug domain-containing protein, partial [Bacteroidota bacterium]